MALLSMTGARTFSVSWAPLGKRRDLADKTCVGLAQKCHKHRFKNRISDCRCGVFPKPNHSIGNGEVDSSILSGSTIFIQQDQSPAITTLPKWRRASKCS
jgi:hypothetical protein